MERSKNYCGNCGCGLWVNHRVNSQFQTGESDYECSFCLAQYDDKPSGLTMTKQPRRITKKQLASMYKSNCVECSFCGAEVLWFNAVLYDSGKYSCGKCMDESAERLREKLLDEKEKKKGGGGVVPKGSGSVSYYKEIKLSELQVNMLLDVLGLCKDLVRATGQNYEQLDGITNILDS
jgi:hypothetical protein